MSGLDIQKVLQKHTSELMDIPGVTGVAVGETNGVLCIRVFVDNGNTECLDHIPNTLEGFPVLIDGGGDFRALHISD
jgi:hypothetical protein